LPIQSIWLIWQAILLPNLTLDPRDESSDEWQITGKLLLRGNMYVQLGSRKRSSIN